jgi:hypothetical protein
MGLILINIWVRLGLIITQSGVEINCGDFGTPGIGISTGQALVVGTVQEFETVGITIPQTQSTQTS